MLGHAVCAIHGPVTVRKSCTSRKRAGVQVQQVFIEDASLRTHFGQSVSNSNILSDGRLGGSCSIFFSPFLPIPHLVTFSVVRFSLSRQANRFSGGSFLPQFEDTNGNT